MPARGGCSERPFSRVLPVTILGLRQHDTAVFEITIELPWPISRQVCLVSIVSASNVLCDTGAIALPLELPKRIRKTTDRFFANPSISGIRTLANTGTTNEFRKRHSTWNALSLKKTRGCAKHSAPWCATWQKPANHWSVLEMLMRERARSGILSGN